MKEILMKEILKMVLKGMDREIEAEGYINLEENLEVDLDGLFEELQRIALDNGYHQTAKGIDQLSELFNEKTWEVADDNEEEDADEYRSQDDIEGQINLVIQDTLKSLEGSSTEDVLEELKTKAEAKKGEKSNNQLEVLGELQELSAAKACGTLDVEPEEEPLMMAPEFEGEDLNEDLKDIEDYLWLKAKAKKNTEKAELLNALKLELQMAARAKRLSNI